MIKRLLVGLMLVILKVGIRIALASWLVPKIFPSDLATLILVCYCIVVFGKMICGGYNRKIKEEK